MKEIYLSIEKAVKTAIKEITVEKFKETSFFMSNRKE